MRSTEITLRPLFLLAIAWILLLSGCRSTDYGGKTIPVKVLIEGPEIDVLPAGTTATEIRGWILSVRTWNETQAQTRLAELERRRRAGEHAKAKALLDQLSHEFDKKKSKSINRRESVLQLQLRDYVLVVKHAARLVSKKFNTTTMDPKEVRMTL